MAKARKPRKKKKAVDRAPGQRATIKDLVVDIRTKIHKDASEVLGGMGVLWPLKRFLNVPGSMQALFYIVFDNFKDNVLNRLEAAQLQLREYGRSLTALNRNLVMLERLAYDQHGQEKIKELWDEYHAVMAVSWFLNQFAPPPPPPEPEKTEETGQEVTDEVLQEMARGEQIETGKPVGPPEEHPEGATIFGGD